MSLANLELIIHAQIFTSQSYLMKFFCLFQQAASFLETPSGSGVESALDDQDLAFHQAKRTHVRPSDELVCQARNGDRRSSSWSEREGFLLVACAVFGTSHELPYIGVPVRVSKAFDVSCRGRGAMAKTTPIVRGNTLTYQQGGQEQVLLVETPAWYAWLETASSFAFTSQVG